MSYYDYPPSVPPSPPPVFHRQQSPEYARTVSSYGSEQKPGYLTDFSPAPSASKPGKDEWGTSISKPHKKKKKKGRGSCCILLVGVTIILVGLAATSLFLTGFLEEEANENVTSAPTLSPTEILIPSFPEEIRENEEDLIGITFLEGPQADQVVAKAAIEAVERWNIISRGTLQKFNGQFITSDEQLCGLFSLGDQVRLEHMLLVVSVDEDRNGFFLGTCEVSNFPVVITIVLGRNIIDQLEEAGSGVLNAFLVKNIGRLMGFGLQFPLATQGSFIAVAGFPRLAQNLIFNNPFDPNAQPNPNFPNSLPDFFGLNAVAEFRNLIGNQNAGIVPLEDGIADRANGAPEFGVPSEQLAGRLLVDINWDSDFFLGEMFEAFIEIDENGGIPPISRVSLAAFIDLGYTMDLSLADAFVFNFGAQKRSGKKKARKVVDVDKYGTFYIKNKDIET